MHACASLARPATALSLLEHSASAKRDEDDDDMRPNKVVAPQVKQLGAGRALVVRNATFPPSSESHTGRSAGTCPPLSQAGEGSPHSGEPGIDQARRLEAATVGVSLMGPSS